MENLKKLRVEELIDLKSSIEIKLATSNDAQESSIDMLSDDLFEVDEELASRGVNSFLVDKNCFSKMTDKLLIKCYINSKNYIWSIMEKSTGWKGLIEDAHKEKDAIKDELEKRKLKLEAEIALEIHKGRITQDRVDELKKMSTEKLESELEDGMQIMEEYYGNTFYIQKYEDDESFMKAGDGISAENSIISLILESRGNYKEYESSEISEIPLTIENTNEEKNKEVAVTITNNA